MSEFGHRLMLETEQHKVVFNVITKNAIGLYDLDADPGERTNLIDTPAAHNVLDALRWQLADTLLPLRTTP